MLRSLEEALLTLCWTGDADYDIPDLPPLLAGRRPLEAVRHLMDALAPSQRTDDAPRPGRLLALNGRYEHAPLVPVEVAEQDLVVLAQTAQLTGAARPHTDLVELLQETYDHRSTEAPPGTDRRHPKDRRLLCRRRRGADRGEGVRFPETRCPVRGARRLSA